MIRFPSDKPAKNVEKETEVNQNQDDRNVETSIIPLDSSTDWCLSHDSVSWLRRDGYVDVSSKDVNEFEKFDDEGMEMVQEEESVNVTSDWATEEEFPVNVATLPVGDVISVKGNQVIVEGKEKHYLLTKGSFLWITETRAPLGYVDEIFETVKNKPCYSVRLESESQVPEGISQGTQVSLIVADSVQHDKKGYDASSSGDEKEAEYRKMQKKMMKMEMTSEQFTSNTGNNRKQGTEQRLLSPNSSPVMPQAIAGTVLSPNRSDSQVSNVRPQAIAGTGGLVSQLQPLLPQRGISATNAAPWRPETNWMGLMPMPNPTMYYPQLQFKRRPWSFVNQNYISQQPFGLNQPYPNGAPWPEMNSQPFPPQASPQLHPQMQHIQSQTQSQRLTTGQSSSRGREVHHRGGDSGFRRRKGRSQQQPPPRR